MFASGVIRLMSVACVCAVLSSGAFAQDTGGEQVDRADIQRRIAVLREQYRKALDAGESSDEIRSLLRDVNGAISQGDWVRAAELLHAQGGDEQTPAETDAGDAALWPVRTSTTTQEKVDPFILSKTTYTGIDGLTLGALVYRPRPKDPTATQPKYPAILLGHGGLRGVPLAYRRLAEAFASVGYIVYVPEFRGQGQSKGKVEYGGGEVLDLLSALGVLKELEGVDSNRIGMVGGGHGGLVTLLALARAEGISCAAAISTPTDLSHLVRESTLFKRDLKLYRVPLDLNDPNLLRQRSPLFYASGVQVPVMILHGARDTTIPAKSAEGYASVLKARGKDVVYEEYTGRGTELASKLDTYEVDLQNFLAARLKPSGWKIKKPGGKKNDRRRRH